MSDTTASHAMAWPYYTPVYLTGKTVRRLALVECPECDWFAVSGRGTDANPCEGMERFETHYAAAHVGRGR